MPTPEETVMPARKMPPWTEQVANAAGAVSRVVRAVSKGDKVLASDAAVTSRLVICDDCPFSSPDSRPVQDRRCAKCGCFISKKVKFVTEKCPAGKWS
jgi:hypothetical protein